MLTSSIPIERFRKGDNQGSVKPLMFCGVVTKELSNKKKTELLGNREVYMKDMHKLNRGERILCVTA